VVKPGNEFHIFSENHLDGTPHMASITPFEDSFLLRTGKGLYRIGKKN
jgi:hypothetical protein